MTTKEEMMEILTRKTAFDIIIIQHVGVDIGSWPGPQGFGLPVFFYRSSYN